MIASKVSYDKTNALTPIIHDYLFNGQKLSGFFSYPFELNAFKEEIANRNFPEQNRTVLVQALSKQYESLDTSPKTRENIELLVKPNTFTITTAHQPNIFTGRLYFIYKIIDAINIAEQLNRTCPDQRFVPVYYMGCEDHDFEEINHIYLFGKKLEWQAKSGGPVGRMSTEGIQPLVQEIEEKLSNRPFSKQLIQLLKEAYEKHETLAEATFYLVNTLFSEYGLVVVNPDNKDLKALFKPVIKEELTSQVGISLAEESIQSIEKLGYKAQAHPREINFFYLTDSQRLRFVYNQHANKYEVLETDLQFSERELLELMDKHPELFSPNVFYRPLYQETILPNLAYVGGGGELAYWLQQKPFFDHFKVSFPMLILRNLVMLIDPNTQKKMEKNDITLEDLFQDEEKLVKDFVKNRSESVLELRKEKDEINKVFDQVLEKAVSVDATLRKAVEGQKAGIFKGLENIESKILRAEKKNFEISTNQIRDIKHKLFPEGNLQERYDNFLPWYATSGPAFIKTLKERLDPFDKQFTVLLQDGV